jgi:hypothetical protein
MPLEHEVDGLAGGGERRVRQRPLAEHRGIAGRHQQHVALAQGHVQPVGQMQHHVAARLCASGLHEAQVAGRDLRLSG